MDQIYRTVIDALVNSCLHGQGQIAARKLREGVWNRNADDYTPNPFGEPEWMRRLDEEWRVVARAQNEMLRRLSPADRELLAEMFCQEFQSGVHESLVVLHEHRIPPFDSGYEGDPYHDFVGRLDDWEWPAD